MNATQLGYMCLGAPLLGAVFAYIGAYKNSRSGQWVCVSAIFLSFLAGIGLFRYSAKTDLHETINLIPWIKSEIIRVDWGFLFDPLSTAMILVITFVSFLVHVYSVEYMQEETDKLTFFAHLNLFTFMMLFLVSAPNLLQMFCGWEGVGLASYLLIGFWHEKSSATTASIKAFVVNRIGDVFFVLALGAIFYNFQTLEFESLFAILNEKEALPSSCWLNIIGIFLLIGAMGKSGQFGLHIWLPDAMEAPTPVSALLHAATMVTAGVFLVIRFSPLFVHAPIANEIMMLVGLVNTFFAGFVAITQTDIKKVIAYSTCSQLGMMFMACAAGAYSVAFFHLFTHAFFKALLFLCAGAVIHGMSHEQNIFKMGGLKSYLPSCYCMMIIGTLSLTGFPFFAGHYSKDLIFESVYSSNFSYSHIYYGLCLLITFITGLYSWRLLFLVFHGKSRADEHVIAHIHKTGKKMQYPIYVLAFGAVTMGYIGFKILIQESFGFSWADSLVKQQHFEETPMWVGVLPLFFAVLALGICYYLYVFKPNIPDGIAQQFPKLYKFLKNSCYIDLLYCKKIAPKFAWIGDIFYTKGDRGTIDRLGPNGFSDLVFKIGGYFQKIQTGFLSHSVMVAVLGAVLIFGSYLVMQLCPQLSKQLLLVMGRL